MQPETVIFWGAGSTKALGIRTTVEQGQFIRWIADDSRTLEGRVARALPESDFDQWRTPLVDIIRILGDGKKSYLGINNIEEDEKDSMRRNWNGFPNDEEIRGRIVDLRTTYDWPALKSVVGVCPGITTDRFRLNDLFNLLDMHIPSGFGFRGPAGLGDDSSNKDASQPQFLDARRLIGAKNALLMVLITMFYIDYQVCIATKRDMLQKYEDVALLLGHRMRSKGVGLANTEPLDSSGFYQGDVGFVSMNYDPILFWVQFIANHELKNRGDVPHIGSPAVPLHLYVDFGHLIPSRRIGKGDARAPWYPMNEAVAQRLNESKAGAERVRLTKILYPHGCLCWRECPDCGKLSAYHGDEWNLAAADLLPPPPLLGFNRNSCPDGVPADERARREEGMIDARSCLHCGTLTSTNHTQVIMQSSFKSQPPSFIEEIQRDLRAMTMRANHIILMGYSLPPDDVTYRAFFAARSQRGKVPVHCTVVNKDGANPGWYRPDELETRTIKPDSPVKAAQDFFGEQNVRFYGGGIPEVFLDGGLVTEAKLDKLLVWA